MKVSILIPCYNAALMLWPCLESVVEQNILSDSEIILIDDGSTDDSYKIAKLFQEYALQYYPTIEIIIKRRGNLGSQKTRNELLSLARGEYIKFLDADDYLLPNCLRQQIEFAQEYQLDGVYSQFILQRWTKSPELMVHYDNREQRPSYQLKGFPQSEQLLDTGKSHPLQSIIQPNDLAHFPQISSCLFHRRVFNQISWDETIEVVQDVKLIADLFLAGYRIKYLPIVASVYRWGWSKNQITQKNLAFYPELSKLRDHILTTRLDHIKFMTGCEPLNHDHRTQTLELSRSGRLTVKELSWLYDISKGRVLEIGCDTSQAAIAIARKLQRFGGQLICLDHWNPRGRYQTFLNDLLGLGLSSSIINAEAIEVVEQFDDQAIDVIYCQRVPSVALFKLYLPKLKPSGIFLTHHPELIDSDLFSLGPDSMWYFIKG